MTLVFPAMSEAQRYSYFQVSRSSQTTLGDTAGAALNAEADRGKDTPGTDNCLSHLHAPPHADPAAEGVLSIVSQIIDRLWSWELSSTSYSTPSNSSCNKCAAPPSIMTASMASKNSVDNVYIEQLNTEDPHMERGVLRKIDFRLLPILGALYTIALIDRTNISVARISGLDDDLDLKVGNRASVVLLVSHILRTAPFALPHPDCCLDLLHRIHPFRAS